VGQPAGAVGRAVGRAVGAAGRIVSRSVEAVGRAIGRSMEAVGQAVDQVVGAVDTPAQTPKTLDGALSGGAPARTPLRIRVLAASRIPILAVRASAPTPG